MRSKYVSSFQKSRSSDRMESSCDQGCAKRAGTLRRCAGAGRCRPSRETTDLPQRNIVSSFQTRLCQISYSNYWVAFQLLQEKSFKSDRKFCPSRCPSWRTPSDHLRKDAATAPDVDGRGVLPRPRSADPPPPPPKSRRALPRDCRSCQKSKGQI